MTRAAEATRSIDLEALVRDLRDSNIYVGVQTNGLGMLVWISDQVHGRRVDHVFDHPFERAACGEPESGDSASRWLHAKALELFPDSCYALRYRR
jgi:hypothetical protein